MNDDIIIKAKQIQSENPNVIFLIQSDETEFITTVQDVFPENSICFHDEIRHINKCYSTVDIIMKNKNHEFSKNI